MKNIHITLTNFKNESRVLKEIRTLKKSGYFHEFLVVALGDNKLSSNENIESNFKVIRLNLITSLFPKNAFFLLIKFFEFFIRVYILLLRERPAVINVHTLALLPLGWLAKFTLKSKLVYDAHELETEKNGLVGFRKRVSKFIEKIFIKHCDLIIVVGENIAKWYADTYKIEPPLVVKNSPNRREYQKKDLFREKLGIPKKQKILLYQGGLVKGRGIEFILKAFQARKSCDVAVIFMGYGVFAEEIKKISNSYDNIYFFPAVKPDIVLEYTSSADFGISFIENTCLSYYYCMPNKLFEYAIVGLPIIVSNMKEMSECVEKYKFGIVLKESIIESLNKAIDELYNRDLTKISQNAYNFAIQNAWEAQEKIMLQGYRRMLHQ